MTEYKIARQYEDRLTLPDWVHCVIAFVVFIVWPASVAIDILVRSV